MINPSALLPSLELANNDIQKAKARRKAIIADIVEHVRGRMKVNKLHRGIINKRLGWPEYRLGNLLHNFEGVSLPELKRLLETIEIPCQNYPKSRDGS